MDDISEDSNISIKMKPLLLLAHSKESRANKQAFSRSHTMEGIVKIKKENRKVRYVLILNSQVNSTRIKAA